MTKAAVEQVEPVVAEMRVVDDALRKNLGNIGAFDELCRGLRKDYDAFVKSCPIGDGGMFFLTVQGVPRKRS